MNPINWLKAKLKRSPSGATVATWPERWSEAWEERAAIMEFDGCLSRTEAEAAAANSIQMLMKNQVKESDLHE